MSKMLTAKEAADELRCSPTKIRRLFKQGELEGFYLGSDIRIYPASVTGFMARHANAKRPEQSPAPAAPRRRATCRPMATMTPFL